MGDSFVTSCRLPAFKEVAPTQHAQRVISLLGLEGVRDRVPGFDAALSHALWHDSYLYEHRSEVPCMTPGVLGALAGLGSTWVSRELTMMVVGSRHDEKPGPVSRTVAESTVAFAQQVLEREQWVRDCGSFSGSLAEYLPPRVRLRLLHQVIGISVLVGGEAPMRAYLSPALGDALREAGSQSDWATMLSHAATQRGVPVDWSFASSGPDHAREFVATCRVGGRLQVEAQGPSKKAARRAAAKLMLNEHFPRVLCQRSAQVEAPRLPLFVPRSDNPNFSSTVARIAQDFGCGVGATPLIAQAFLHSSWVYENRDDVANAQQRDHGVLGFIGSEVLAFEASLAETALMVAEPAETYAHRTHERRTDVEALRVLRFEPAIMLGRGQRLSGFSDEIHSSVFQGLMAALYMSLGSPKSLFESWPRKEPWDAVRELIAPGTVREADVTTRVQEFAAPCGLRTTYEFDREGPDHDALYRARLTLDSPSLRRRVMVRGEARGSKSGAKHAASAIVVDWIEALNDADALSSIARSGGSDLSGTTFLLAHLCEVAGSLSAVPVPWQRRGLLGSTLEPEELGSWAAAADGLLRRQARAQLPPGALVEYFRLTSGDATRGLPLSGTLAETLEWVAGLDQHEFVDSHQQRRLVDLAAAYRCLGGDQQAVFLGKAVEGQVLLSRGRLHADAESATDVVPAAVVAALDSLIGLMLSGGRCARMEDVEGNVIALHWVDPTSGSAEELEPTIEVWRQIGVSITLGEGPPAVYVNLPVDKSNGHGPISRALRVARVPQRSPLAAAIANLLHDLKNQVAAADVLATSSSEGTRTQRLERQLETSRHLDQAAALAERIRAASSLLRPTDAEATPLSTFLRRYASAMLVRIPATVSLDIGAGTDDLAVAMGEAALTAALDNLIKNSVEAMPNGGRITVDWTHDDEAAVVEIADDGPGLPETVRAAFDSGGRVDSTKTGGNGLGLLGVRTLLRRVGGIFELVPSATGTVWHLTISLAEEQTS